MVPFLLGVSTAVARKLELSWDQVDTIMKRAVERGLARRERHAPRRIGIDETSFQKRHGYVTVVMDQDEDVVLHVADGRDHGALVVLRNALRGRIGRD